VYVDEIGLVQSGNLVAISTRNKHNQKDRQTPGTSVSVCDFWTTNHLGVYTYLLQEFQYRLILRQDGAQLLDGDVDLKGIIQTDDVHQVGGTL